MFDLHKQLAIETAANGDPQKAAELLVKAIQEDPNSQECWYWLGQVLDDPERKQFCFLRILSINPDNQHAWQALNALENPKSKTNDNIAGIPQGELITDPIKEKQVDNKPLNQEKIKPNIINWIKYLNLKSNWTALLLGFLLCQLLITFPLSIMIQLGGLDNFISSRGWIVVPEIPQGDGTVHFGYADNTPIPTSDAPYPERMAKAESLLAEAQQYRDNNDFLKAIEVLDKAISLTPDYDVLYFQRAYCYYKIYNNYFSDQIAIEILNKGIDDLDTLILINPTDSQAYIMRGIFYRIWASFLDLQVDRNVLLESAIENFQYAEQLGADNSDVSLAFALVEAGQCKEAQPIIDQYFKDNTATDNDYAFVQLLQAYAFTCEGDAEKGLEILNQIKIYSEDENYYLQTKSAILYLSGHMDEALDLISNSSGGVSNYLGYSDYLSAAIYYDSNQPDVALDYLESGRKATDFEGGLYGYVNGSIDIQSQDHELQEQGIQELQYAEASLGPLFNIVRWRIQKELAEYNASPMEATISVPQPTTMASLDPRENRTTTPSGPQILETPVPIEMDTELIADETPQATQSPETVITELHTPSGTIKSVDMEQGVDDIVISMGGRLVYHFEPPVDLLIEQVYSLHFFTETGNTDLPSPIIELWDPELSIWTSIQPDWGESNVTYPGKYVFPEGDIYVAIRSASASLNLEKLDMGLVFKDQNGFMMGIGRME